MIIFLHLELYLYELIQHKFTMEKVNSLDQVVNYFKHYDNPVFFVGAIHRPAVLHLFSFIQHYQIITCNDPYLGAYNFIKVPQFVSNGTHKCKILAGEFCPISLIGHPQVIEHIKSKGGKPKILIAHSDLQIERICAENGFQIWASPLKLYDYLGNKVQILNILNKVDVPTIPNICSNITSYQHLKDIASIFGSDHLVVQNQLTHSGIGTMFINNEADYLAYQSTLQNGKKFKIMKRRNLKCFAIVGVATKNGAILGPLVSDMIGHPNLTHQLGGYCGNQIRSSYFQDKQLDIHIRRKIYEYTERFINYIYNEGLFKGSFGCDYSVDLQTNQIFFMEINPRLTGSTTLSFELYEVQGYKFPIYLYHCLEYQGVNIDLDVKALTNEWIGLKNYQQQYSQVLCKAFSIQQAFIPQTFPTGIWKIENGKAKPTGKLDFRVKSLQQDEIIVIPLKGTAKLKILVKGRIQDYNFKLLPKYNDIIDQLIDYRLKDIQLK